MPKTKQTIMKTTMETLWKSLLVVLLGTLLAAEAHGQIFVSSPGNGTVGKYNFNVATVKLLNTGLAGAAGLALSGNNLDE